jgi:hypothetical protein
MGHQVPDDWPEILISGWYKVTVDRHVINPPGGGCGNALFDSKTCCVSGALLHEFVTGDHQCANWDLCIGPPVGMNQRITNISGPYLTQLDCFHAL